MNFHHNKCAPCKGDTQPLSREQATAHMGQIPGWELSEDASHLVLALRRKDFVAVIALVNQVAQLAESEGHHPNIHIHSWNRVEFTVFTHKIGGLHQNDFILAAKINQLL